MLTASQRNADSRLLHFLFTGPIGNWPILDIHGRAPQSAVTSVTRAVAAGRHRFPLQESLTVRRAMAVARDVCPLTAQGPVLLLILVLVY